MSDVDSNVVNQEEINVPKTENEEVVASGNVKEEAESVAEEVRTEAVSSEEVPVEEVRTEAVSEEAPVEEVQVTGDSVNPEL